MFVDLRGSSSISERHLPYDVLFILNQFFLEMTDALVDSEGHYAQFEGDGLLALYGLKRGMKTGCLDAIRGAMNMQNRMNLLNEKLSGELGQALKFGIGIHCGSGNRRHHGATEFTQLLGDRRLYQRRRETREHVQRTLLRTGGIRRCDKTD